MQTHGFGEMLENFFAPLTLFGDMGLDRKKQSVYNIYIACMTARAAGRLYAIYIIRKGNIQ